MNRHDVVFRGRAVIDDAVADASVGVRAGRIAEIAPGDADLPTRQRVELTDDEVLLPGLVDSHVHVNEPGRTHWEGFASATRAAAAGGVTTIVDMPLNSVPPTVDPDALQRKRSAAADQVYVDVAFWGGAVPHNLGRLADLHASGVVGFKCFLVPSGVDEFAPLDAAQLERVVQEVAAFDGLLVVHAEDAAVIAHAPAAGGRDYADFLRSRPHEAEDVAIRRVVELAARHRARVHILHLSSADALSMLADARAGGVCISVETCPHYLTVAAEEIPAGATEFKCCPPVRGTANQQRLWEGLAARTVDCVVSDHSPSPPELKLVDDGDFGAAWGGISSLQLGLPVVWTAARSRGHPLTDVVRWMARRPAEITGVHGKGRIGVGQDADLVVFAPEETFTVDPAALHHRHALTPYAGRALSGVVRRTFLRGRPVADGGGVEEPPHGQLLTREGTHHA